MLGKSLALVAITLLAKGRAACPDTPTYCAKNLYQPSVAFMFDFGENTALAANRQMILESLNTNVLVATNNKTGDCTVACVQFINTGCSGNLAATVATPEQGVTGCQNPGDAISSQYSCAFAQGNSAINTPGEPSKFYECLMKLPYLSNGQSDFISGLSRVRNGGTNCNGLFNNCNSAPKTICTGSGAVNLPCTPATTLFAQNQNNVLIIFWSSRIYDVTNIQKWLTNFFEGKYINIYIVPIVSANPNLLSANENDFKSLTFTPASGGKIEVFSNLNAKDSMGNPAKITDSANATSLAQIMTAVSTNLVQLATDTDACTAKQPANIADYVGTICSQCTNQTNVAPCTGTNETP